VRLATLGLGALALVVSAAPAAAQTYPGTKPVRLIVPMTPGGGTDILSRVIANKLQEQSYTVVVENRPGAGGNIGADVAAKAAPDGYTMVMGQTSNLAINPTLYPHLSFDPLKDFAPVVLVADAPLVMVVRAQSPIKSVADLVAAAKSKPASLTMASPGNGTASHLSSELFQIAAGIKLVHVPYKGAAQATTDVLGGQVDMMMSSVPSAMGQIQQGTLRAIAVTSSKRSSALPDVPTLAEAGYPGFNATSWYGLLMPAGTPQAIVNQLNAQVNKVLQTADIRDKVALEGGNVLGGSPQDFADLLKSEYAKWSSAVKASGAKIN